MASEGLLAIEASPEGDVMHVHGSPSGLRRLGEELIRLAQQAELGEFPHTHLFSPEWGGCELSTLKHEASHTLVHHLKIFGWPSEEGGIPYRGLPTRPTSST